MQKIKSTIMMLIVVSTILLSRPFPAIALTPSQIFEKVKDSILVVHSLNTQGKVISQGSGVLISSGRVATNCHVVEGGVSYQVGRGSQLISATLYAEDGDKDICILIADGIDGKPAETGKASNLKVGDPVYAVGAPRGLELSLSDGIVSQVRGGPPPLIQTTAAISPGSSGGGLFDGEGRLVGLTTLYVDGGQSLNFAMPVEWVSELKSSSNKATEYQVKTAWLKRAIALENVEDWKGLLAWCQKWTKAEPNNSFAWCGIAYAYNNLDRYEDAIEAYRHALSIDPNLADAYFNLGLIYFNLKRYNEAIETYCQVLRIDPQYSKAWNNLGISYGNLNRHNDSINAFLQVLRIDSKNAKAWCNLGMVYSRLNRFDDAIKAYREALGIDPHLSEAWNDLAVTYGNLNRYDDEIEVCQQALRVNPHDADIWYNLGCAYLNLKQFNDAIKAYRQTLRINPQHANAWNNLAVSFALAGNRKAALDAVWELRRFDSAKSDKLMKLIGASNKERK